MEFLILDHCGTGTVLCGIVGKTRFKFDVWSNDVNFANKMESTGKPGQVHISEKTYKFLKDDYLVEEGEILNGTFYINTTNFSSFDCGVSDFVHDVKCREKFYAVMHSQNF